jgi:hypothetical protein
MQRALASETARRKRAEQYIKKVKTTLQQPKPTQETLLGGLKEEAERLSKELDQEQSPSAGSRKNGVDSKPPVKQ